MENKQNDKQTINFKSKETIHNKTEIKSRLFANAVFHFVNDIQWFEEALKEKRLCPRYCKEDISYLNIAEFQSAYIAEKCFCDIPLHKIENHTETYGRFGIGLSKQWAKKMGIQPVQYVNNNSELFKDYSSTFNTTLMDEKKYQGNCVEMMKNNMLFQLAFLKPIEGTIFSKKPENKYKCLQDECEWRFVPTLADCELSPIYTSSVDVEEMSNILKEGHFADLLFQYEDIMHLVVSDRETANTIIDFILELEASITEKNELISKLYVLNEMGCDV